MKRNEKYIVVGLLVVSFLMLVFYKMNRKDALMVNVKNANEEIVLRFNINEDNYYELDGKIGKFHIEVKDGKCRAIDVDCPNQICVHTGWISQDNPATIVCLPNGLAVIIDD